MERKRGKSILMAAAAGILALIFILLCYYLLNAPDDASEITLPDYTVTPVESVEKPPENSFAAISKENVAQAIEALQPLEAYHVSLTVEYFWADGGALQPVELWQRSGETHLRLTDPAGGADRHILLRTDGAWLWYDGETPVSLEADGLRAEELAGLPAYLDWNASAEVLDAQSASLAGGSRDACIYVRWRLDESRTAACWIALDTGLLVRAVLEENGVMVYRLQQQSCERLLPGDEAYQTAFLLPDEVSEN